MEEMDKKYAKACEKWVLKAKKATANKTKAYAKVVLPHYDGSAYTEEEFSKIINA